MHKLTGLYIVAAVTGTVWWQFPNITARSLTATAQTERKASDSSNAYQAMARRLMQQAQAEAGRGNNASANRLALHASRFPVKWSADELSPTQLLSQLQRGREAPPQINLAGIAGRQLPAQSKPSNEFVIQASETATNSSPLTFIKTGFNDSKSRPNSLGSIGEASQLLNRAEHGMPEATATWQNAEPVHRRIASAPALPSVPKRLNSADEKALLTSELDTVRSLFDETPGEKNPPAIHRFENQAPRLPETLVQPGKNGQSEEPTRLSSDPVQFSALPAQVSSSAAVSDGVFERLDQPQSAHTDQATSISDNELARQLLAESRQLMRDGRFDDARAAAIRAKNLNVTFDVLSDTPEVVLHDIDYISEKMALTEIFQARLDTLPDPNVINPATAALGSQNEKCAKPQRGSGSAEQLVERHQDANAVDSLIDGDHTTVMSEVEHLQTQLTSSNPPASFKASNPAAEQVDRITSYGEENPLRKHVDLYIDRAHAAWQEGDQDEAVRQAAVATLLSNPVNLPPCEKTPVKFSARSDDAVIIPFQGSFEEVSTIDEIPPFEEMLTIEETALSEQDSQELITETPAHSNHFPTSDDSQLHEVNVISQLSSSINRDAPVELSNPSFKPRISTAHGTQSSTFSPSSARGTELWLTNDSRLRPPTAVSE